MPNQELMPVFEGRPPVIKRDGWVVFVAVRDAAYMQTLRSYKHMLRDSHPDRGGKAATFRRIMGERLKWQNQEAEWYSHHELLPPDGYRKCETRVERTKRLRGGR